MIKKQFLVVLILFIVCMTLCMLAGVQQVSAAPAMPGVIQIFQPDGNLINAHIIGDQYQNWVEADNGCAIVMNQQTGYWEFAVQDAKGNMIPSGTIYQSDVNYPGSLKSQLFANTTQSAVLNIASGPGLALSGAWGSNAATGDKKMLVILVSFANRAFVSTPSDWNTTFFSSTAGAKSLANYFNDNSIGKVSISPVTHTQTGNPAGVISVTLAGNHPNTGSVLNLATETTWANQALAAASSYIDFSTLDTNANGVLDTDEASVYFILSGYDASSTTELPSIWSHSTIDFTGSPELTVDGIKIRRWSATGERADAAQRTRMGIVTHEAAHLLFNLPDLFDTTAKTPGVGIFSLMGTGCWGLTLADFVQGATPVNLDAWSRQYLGWATPRIPMTTASMTFAGALSSANAPVKLADPRVSTNEYYLIENRPPTGWDAGMLRSFVDSWSGGLLVLHIDEGIGSPALNTINHYTAGGHQGVMVDEASTVNGSLYLTGTSFSDGNKRHLFYSGNNGSFTSSTTPNSKLYDGTNIGVGVSAISSASASMTGTVTPCAAVSTPTFLPDGGTYEVAKFVAMSTANTTGSTIYYTTDGTTPSSSNGILYTTPVKVNKDVTLRAIAYYPDVPTSAVKVSFYDITGNPPVNSGLTPNNGTIITNTKTVLSSLYSDIAGGNNMKTCYLHLNPTFAPNDSGYFFYNATKNRLYLRKANIYEYIGGFAPGSNNVIDNGYLVLYCKDTQVIKTATGMTIKWSIALKSSFAGKTVDAWMRVTNNAGLPGDWTQVGVFSVVGNPPVNVSLAPNTGSITKDLKTTLTSVYSDAGGYANLKNAYLAPVTSIADINSKGYFLYDSINNKLYLRSAGASTFIGGYAPGTAMVLDNGIYKLYCADTTVTRLGNNLTVNWSLAIESTFTAASCNAYMQITNQFSKSDPWEQMGAFTLN